MEIVGTVDDVSLSDELGGTQLRVRTELSWAVVDNVRSFRVANNGTLVITRVDLSTVAFALGGWKEAWQNR